MTEKDSGNRRTGTHGDDMATSASTTMFDPLMGLVDPFPLEGAPGDWRVSPKDRRILRELAQRVAASAADPVMTERVDLWKRHNALHPTRPLVLVFPEGAWRELLPRNALCCETDRTRRIEQLLRCRLYRYEHIPDDLPITNEWRVEKVIKNSGWGLEGRRVASHDPNGAYAFEPVLKEFGDLEKLRIPIIEYDANATLRDLEEAQELFGDILNVTLKGVSRLHFGMMYQLTAWRGLEELFLDLCVNPGFVHDAMHFLTEAHKGILRQYVEQNLLSLNNDGTYHASGGLGWTDELPAPGFDSSRVRPCDLWASSESQELTAISPDMHEEFALDYERRLLEPFGLTGYGCCEDLTDKLDRVLRLPHLRRVSVSPWANVARCAEQLGNRYILAWKVQPAHLVGPWDEDLVRSYLRDHLKAARDGIVEVILKDTHTVEHRPERLEWWTRIARTLAEEG